MREKESSKRLGKKDGARVVSPDQTIAAPSQGKCPVCHHKGVGDGGEKLNARVWKHKEKTGVNRTL